MKAKKRKQAAKQKTPAPQEQAAERMQRQRQRLFQAMAIIDCCLYGSDSMMGDGDEDGPDIEIALGVAYDLVNDVAEALEVLTRR